MFYHVSLKVYFENKIDKYRQAIAELKRVIEITSKAMFHYLNSYMCSRLDGLKVHREVLIVGIQTNHYMSRIKK